MQRARAPPARLGLALGLIRPSTTSCSVAFPHDIKCSVFSRQIITGMMPDYSRTKDLYANKFHFCAVALSALVVFPCVYIPGFNDKVFQMKLITWEWALAVGAVFIFVAGMEAWKRKFARAARSLLELSLIDTVLARVAPPFA
ncbi:hypothetical protein BDV95DRAFT_611312 [Massariosphaeria phaeospora]|uniref:Cation-transporting P-type ATPase C-terminal domain-containing protein n=1 Tax=Massariosphaeria phaeospora TaxID=100035 RepID=A0A7C8M2V7_9PLEO|nr:hypothetical protein BDV95DRAFT_611312 [Massariosphaeria phaeospora]